MRTALALLVIAMPVRSQDAAPDVRRPNIVMFLVDDMGWQDTSVAFHTERTPFNDFYRTPSMERLARTGVRFTQSYACAVCSPTRTSLMTGQNAARHHVTQWTLRPGQDPSQRARGMRSPDWNLDGLQPGTPTLPGLLRDAGYTTIHVGKAHWGADGTPGEDPCALGFDVNRAGHAAGGPGSYHGWHDFSAAFRDGDRIWDVPGLDAYHGKDLTLTEALTIEACRELRRAAESDRPFYLYMAHYAVHAPFEEHPPWAERYREQGAAEVEAVYASMVEAMDRSLGAILDQLDELGVAEDTVVMFASDNGGLCFGGRGKTPMGTGAYTHNLPLRSGKGSAYEGGTRVPTIVSWARRARGDDPLQDALPIAPGSVCDRPILVDDWMPTLCAWGGVGALPAAIDGCDVRGYVVGDPEFTRPGVLIWHYPHFYNYADRTRQHGYGPHSAMRDGRHKVIHFYDDGRFELYDLGADLGEQHDLAGEQPELLRSLAERLVAELDRLGAQYPIVDATGEPRRVILP